MPDARQWTMIGLALLASTTAVVAVLTLAPSTDAPGADPLASSAQRDIPPPPAPGTTPARPEAEASERSGGGTRPSAPSTRPDDDGSHDVGVPRDRRAPPLPDGAPSGEAPSNRPGPPSAGGRTTSTAGPAGSGGGGGPGGRSDGGDAGDDDDSSNPEGFKDAASAERADWLEARMTDFVATLTPEFAGEGLSRSCNANGMVCTFEGPATDDFAVRWVQALSAGEMTEDTLQGTNLRDFAFYESDDGLRFSITARHPDR